MYIFHLAKCVLLVAAPGSFLKQFVMHYMSMLISYATHQGPSALFLRHLRNSSFPRFPVGKTFTGVVLVRPIVCFRLGNVCEHVQSPIPYTCKSFRTRLYVFKNLAF